MEKKGIEMTARAATASSRDTTRLRVTVAAHPARKPPPAGRVVAAGGRVGRRGAVLLRQRPVAEVAQRGGHQREGHQHGDDDGQRGGHAHLGQERDADDEQAGERDDHGEPRGHDGGAGGADGRADRRPDVRRRGAAPAGSRVTMNSA